MIQDPSSAERLARGACRWRSWKPSNNVAGARLAGRRYRHLESRRGDPRLEGSLRASRHAPLAGRGAARRDRLQCPYHGWTYDADGQCVSIPAHPEQTTADQGRARSLIRRLSRMILSGSAWASRLMLFPEFEEWGDGSYRKVLCGAYEFQAAGPRMVENFLDVAHFPFVHENILGTQERPEIPDYDVVTDDKGVTASDIRVFQPNPDGSHIANWVSYTYKVYRPLVAYFRKEAAEKFAIFADGHADRRSQVLDVDVDGDDAGRQHRRIAARFSG